MSWNDFNNAEEQTDFDVIPNRTIVKVRMTINPGGYDDPSQGWTGGYATFNEKTRSIYLSCEFVITDGQYARRKIWTLIGLHSDSGPKWSEQGRAMIKGILNSSRGIDPKDNSPQAQNARRIQGLHDLDGIEFVAKLGIEKDQYDELKNVVKTAVTSGHKDYLSVMQGGTHAAAQPGVQAAGHTHHTGQQPAAQSSTDNTAAAPSGRPSWAQ